MQHRPLATPHAPADGDLRELLHHRPPMLLLDRLLACDAEHVTCAVTPRAGGLFVEGGRVPSWVALEYCAQCVAAFAGLRARHAGKPPPRGLLVGARDLQLLVGHFELDQPLTVEAHMKYGESHAGQFDCAVRHGDNLVVSVTLSVYEHAETDIQGPP